MTDLTPTLQRDHIVADAPLSLDLTPSDLGPCTAIAWRITNTGDQPFQGVARLHFDLPDKFTAPWFMVPGYFYGENRSAEQTTGHTAYPRFDPAVDEPAFMTSNRWDFGADRTASPIVYAHEAGVAVAIAADPHVRYEGGWASDDEEPQIGLGFAQRDGRASIRFTVPACDEPFAYNNTPDVKPLVRMMTLEPGASVSGTLYVYDLEGDRHAYQQVVEHYCGMLADDHLAADVPDLEPLIADALRGIAIGHYDAKGNYFVYTRVFDVIGEQIANAKGTTLEWHQDMTGFVGGLMASHGLLRGASIVDDGNARAIAIRVTDRLCRDGISPSGLFWADYVPAQIETLNGTFDNPLAKGREPYGSGWLGVPGWVHSRTIADASDHLASMIALEEARPADARAPSLELWRDALRSNLEAALDLQLPSGSFGQYYHAIEKTVTKEPGCGGLLWIPAMLKAVDLGIGGEAMAKRMQVAVARAGEAYAPYVERESIWGAPEDNESPTSEDGMNAVMAYCDLYEATGNDRFLRLAVIAAEWMLTFRRTFNQQLPDDTVMGRYGLRSRGGDFASVSNNHLHVFEVLCTRHLCKLSEWTGRAYFKERAREHWAFVCQYLVRRDGMYNGFRGAMSEQFYWTHWGAYFDYQPPRNHHQKGHICGFSNAWCIAVLPLAATDARAAFYE